MAVSRRSWALALIVLAGCGSAGGDRLGEAEQANVYCAPGATVEGIDVSYYQGSIDWNAVHGSGREFAVARISDGLSYVDDTFDTNWAGIQGAGMIRGAYQFFEPGEDAAAQADMVVAKVGMLGPSDLPVTIDVEATGGQPPDVINSQIHIWVDRVTQGTGKPPIVYTGKYFWNDNVGTGDFAGLPLWLAAYVNGCPDTPAAWPTWRIWQYTSTGSIPGIAGNVDHDVFDGSLGDLQAFANADRPPKGWLDAADCDGVRGWAQDPDAPDAPIDVHLYFDAPAGDPAAQVVHVHADQHRDDLCAAIGSCEHGYAKAPPRWLMDSAAHDVFAYGIDANGTNNPLLDGSPKTLLCDPPAPPDGVKRWVTSWDSFLAWRFSQLEDVAHVTDDQAAAIPDGPDLDPAPLVVQADDGTPEVWLVDGDLRRHVTDPASLAAWRFDGDGVVQIQPAGDVYAHPVGPDVRPVPLLIGDSTKIYLMDDAFGESTGVGFGAGAGAGVGGGGGGDAADASTNAGCGCEIAGEDRGPGGLALAALALALAVRGRRRSRTRV